MTEHDDDLGDFRVAAAWRLAKDIPAAFSGGPSHKAGTPVYQQALVQTASGEYIGFTIPSATAMALNLAINARDRASELRAAVAFDHVLTPHGYGKSVTSAQSGLLYDFFEQCMVCTTFSFQALEVFCNHTISRDLKDAMLVEIRGKRHPLAPAEIERRLSTEEKLCQVLPKIKQVATPKGKKPWDGFAKLKQARDATIHLKYVDQQAVDNESLFFQFLSGRFTQYPAASIEMISWFCGPGAPRWLGLLSARCNGSNRAVEPTR